MQAKTPEVFREALAELSMREDWTSPEQGWPWPWETSATTDYAYCLEGEHVRVFEFGSDAQTGEEPAWPEFSTDDFAAAGSTRSGLIAVSGP